VHLVDRTGDQETAGWLDELLLLIVELRLEQMEAEVGSRTLHCTALHTAHCTLRIAHCTLHTAHCTLYCALYCTLHWTLADLDTTSSTTSTSSTSRCCACEAG
jgi:hypothetical protein